MHVRPTSAFPDVRRGNALTPVHAHCSCGQRSFGHSAEHVASLRETLGVAIDHAEDAWVELQTRAAAASRARRSVDGRCKLLHRRERLVSPPPARPLELKPSVRPGPGGHAHTAAAADTVALAQLVLADADARARALGACAACEPRR